MIYEQIPCNHFMNKKVQSFDHLHKSSKWFVIPLYIKWKIYCFDTVKFQSIAFAIQEY